jgi:hypothetical protein
VRLIEIQDGSGCHIEKQKYFLTTVFIGPSCSDFVSKTAFTQEVQPNEESETGENPRWWRPPS